MKTKIAILALLCVALSRAQSGWPAESWTSALPLTSVMNANGLTELSGLHWNSETNRLYVVHGDGRLRVLQMDPDANTFIQIGNRSLPGGPEGITQVDYAANEFYTIDENNYEIRKFTHTPNFSSVTETNHWDLLASPSPMQDTGNTGPEGIVFVPDSALTEVGFISEQTDMPYTSVKGMGGLLFVAHQDGGYIWVFDVNPDVTDDFAFVGKYRSGRSESCDLAFDRSTGLLYILHNTGDNYIEVTDLTLTTAVPAEETFTTVNEYFVSNPSDGNENIEGFAISSKCPDGNSVSAWLCRDVESNESTAIQQDAIRWFNPFVADGDCAPLSLSHLQDDLIGVSLFPNPSNDIINIMIYDARLQNSDLRIVNMIGETMIEKKGCHDSFDLDIGKLKSGLYLVDIVRNQTKCIKKLSKN